MSKKLKENQIIAAQLMAQGLKASQIAKKIKVRQETISRWKQDYDFIEKVDEFSKEILKGSFQKIQGLSTLAIQTLENIMQNSSNDRDRMTAASKVLDLVNFKENLKEHQTSKQENETIFSKEKVAEMARSVLDQIERKDETNPFMTFREGKNLHSA
jgi:transcriptional regulator with XRE-family HTH domain